MPLYRFNASITVKADSEDEAFDKAIAASGQAEVTDLIAIEEED